MYYAKGKTIIKEVGSQGKVQKRKRKKKHCRSLAHGCSQQLLRDWQDMLFCLTLGRVLKSWALAYHWVAFTSFSETRNESPEQDMGRRAQDPTGIRSAEAGILALMR